MSTESKNAQSPANVNLKGYADDLVHCIQQLRRDQGIADSQPISTYVTDTEIVRSLLKQYRSYIEEQTNTADLVEVNDDAGIPMPERLPQTEYHIGDQTVTIAIGDTGQPIRAQAVRNQA
jgi:hypothetical protein